MVDLDKVMSEFDTGIKMKKEHEAAMYLLGNAIAFHRRRRTDNFTEEHIISWNTPNYKKAIETLLDLEAIFYKGKVKIEDRYVDAYALSPTAELVYGSGFAFYPNGMQP